ncbi:MAG: hypothetical protein ACI9IL_000537 [Rickettsiales bacterium]|jgi:hypothetical protein
MSTITNKNKKPTTLKESAWFWWSIFWRSHLISVALLLFVTCGFYVISSNNSAQSFSSIILSFVYPGSYQIVAFLFFLLIFLRILKSNTGSGNISAIFWSFIWRYTASLIAIYAIWLCTFYLMLSLSFNINHELYIPSWNLNLNYFIASLISVILGVILVSCACSLGRRPISMLIAIYMIFALIIYILSPFFFLFLYKSDAFFIYSYPTTYNSTVDNLLLVMYLFVIVAGILSKSRIYQVIFNKGLLKYSAIKDLNVTKIKIKKFSI